MMVAQRSDHVGEMVNALSGFIHPGRHHRHERRSHEFGGRTPVIAMSGESISTRCDTRTGSANAGTRRRLGAGGQQLQELPVPQHGHAWLPQQPEPVAAPSLYPAPSALRRSPGPGATVSSSCGVAHNCIGICARNSRVNGKALPGPHHRNERDGPDYGDARGNRTREPPVGSAGRLERWADVAVGLHVVRAAIAQKWGLPLSRSNVIGPF